jgi:ATP-dependent exoDNAse (exonuclease V) beta subunit
MVIASDILRGRGTGLAEGLDVVGASAGSGKTHHLTTVVMGALEGGAEPGLDLRIDIDSLVAVTYTTRAATELRSRIRRELVRRGSTELALRLPLARLGTVHAVCLSWLEDFAIDAGMPPGVKVLPDDGGMQFRRLLEEVIPNPLNSRLSVLAKSLHIKWDSARGRSDWLWHVFEMMELARSNRTAPAALGEMSRRSIEWLGELLPAASTRDLDGALAGALERAEQDLDSATDTTKKTRGVLTQVRKIRRALAQGRALWNDWAVLASLDPGKKSEDLVEAVRNIAAEFEAHPRFQSELREFIAGVFECARLGLERYQSWKARLRLVDYVDMLEHTLQLLDRPEIALELSERLKLIVVDEFQDTSPIQLELFLRLHQLAGRSTWVGDRKQCIFEFAGADPQLMDGVTRWVADHGGQSHQLELNYRSRPELVALCSELFSRALAPHGYSRQEVAVAPARQALAGLAELPPLGVFSLASNNVQEDAAAIARGIQRLLARPTETPILDRQTGRVRPLEAGDIAVLVRSNAETKLIARELDLLQIPAALARPGLLHTPEGTLLDAAVSFLVDRFDGVASATLDALHGFGEGLGLVAGPDRWLEGEIRRRHERKDALARGLAVSENDNDGLGEKVSADELAEQVSADGRLSAWRMPLKALAAQTGQLSPRETVDAVLQALDFDRLVLGWPDSEQRSGNLDALRALADRYEETCRVTGAAASLAGMLHYFDQAREERWDGNEMRATDEQHFSHGSSAVVLCTYHRSKGLEWPVVILASLDAKARDDAFGVKIQAPEGAFDPARPLEGRWIRYLPRPMPGRVKGLVLAEREELSPQGIEARADELRERTRILYVGFTRARDHLVLAARNEKGTLQTCWLDELQSDDGQPLLRLPMAAESEAPQTLVVAGSQTSVKVRSWIIDPEQTADAAMNDTRPLRSWRRPPQAPARQSYWITPSSAADSSLNGLPLRITEAVRVGAPLPVQRQGNVDWAAFGNTVHGFLAADRGQDVLEARTERAQRLLGACASGASLTAESLIRMSDALNAFVHERWPGATWQREIPIRVRFASLEAARQVRGEIDLLLETDEGFIVIDHKTHGNPSEAAVREHAEQYLSQLAAYGRALEALGGKRVLGYWLHFGVAGICLRCEEAR